eukprot:207954-Pelagomonas_calceolata.AAC.4
MYNGGVSPWPRCDRAQQWLCIARMPVTQTASARLAVAQKALCPSNQAEGTEGGKDALAVGEAEKRGGGAVGPAPASRIYPTEIPGPGRRRPKRGQEVGGVWQPEKRGCPIGWERGLYKCPCSYALPRRCIA